jgi:hypothetical protein
MNSTRTSIRHLRGEIRIIALREAARQAYDLMGLGNTTATRLCAALALASVFLIAALGVSIVERFPPSQALPIAGAAFTIVLLPSAVLGRVD